MYNLYFASCWPHLSQHFRSGAGGGGFIGLKRNNTSVHEIELDAWMLSSIESRQINTNNPPKFTQDPKLCVFGTFWSCIFCP